MPIRSFGLAPPLPNLGNVMIITTSPAGPPIGVSPQQADPARAHPHLQGSDVPTGARSAVQERPPISRPDFDPLKLHENLKEAIEELNKQLANSGRRLGIRMDEVLNAPVVTVTSTSTGEVIRQIPSETIIKVAHTLEQLKGLLIDEST